jgi:hypothetical protein
VEEAFSTDVRRKMAQESRMAGALGRFLCRLHASMTFLTPLFLHHLDFLAILMEILVYLTAESFARLMLATLSCFDSGREEIRLAVPG